MSISQKEKLVGLGRTIIFLSIIIISRLNYIFSSLELDFLFIFISLYSLLTVFLNFHIYLSYIYSFVDLIIVTSLIYYTGEGKSPLILFYLLPIFHTTLRFNFIAGIILSLIAGLLFALSFKVRIYFLISNIIFYFGLVFLISFIKEFRMRLNLEKEFKSFQEKFQTQVGKISELKKELQKETISDKLTDLHNLKYFLLRVEEEIAQAKRYKINFSLVLLGVDNFKAYNSIYGEKKANEALRRIGMLLKAYVRNSDLIARYDRTDKFLTIFPFTKGEQAMIPMERFREAVSKYRFDEMDARISLTISVGISSFPDDGDNQNVLLDKAEAALRRAKTQGKNKVCLFS